MILGPDGKPIKKPMESEIAALSSDPWSSFLKVLPNPDLILQKTGRSVEVYEEMKNDAHLWACMTSRKSGVLSKNWDVLPVSQDDRDKEIADFVKKNLEGLNFEQDLRQMLDAVFEGFRVHEVIWESRGGKWWIKSLKARPQRRFTFGTDGSLRLVTAASLDGEPVPGAKFLLVQHEADDDYNPYGVRLFSKCYWPWMFKKHGFKFWAIFTEKYGIPTAVGKHPPGIPEHEKQELLNALLAIVQDAAIAIPNNAEIEFKEAKGEKAAIHELFINFCNQEISKAILSQTLTTEIGDRGSYSAAKVHEDVKQEIVEADAKMVMTAVNTQLVRWLVDFNYGPQEAYPRFVIFYEEEEINRDRAERDKILVMDLGLPTSVDYFYDKYNIPRPGDDEELLVVPSRTTALPPVQMSQDFSQAAQKRAVKADFAEDDLKIMARGDVLESFYQKALEGGRKAYGRLMDNLKEQISSWDSFDDADNLKAGAEAVENLAAYLTDTALTGYMLGEYDAWQDYKQALQEKDFAEGLEIRVTPLPLQEALDYFARLMPVDADEYKKLEQELRAKYFTISRVEGREMVEKIKGYVQEAMEQGQPLEEFKQNVDRLFERMGMGQADPWHLETVFRTNVQTAYGAGHWEKLNDPLLADMFPYYRYSAVLDSRTRDTHRAMHGFIARRDDPIWNEWWPPNGFRCRCGVVAINKYRAARESIKPSAPPKVAPDQGFARNPGRALREVPDNIKEKADFYQITA